MRKRHVITACVITGASGISCGAGNPWNFILPLGGRLDRPVAAANLKSHLKTIRVSCIGARLSMFDREKNCNGRFVEGFEDQTSAGCPIADWQRQTAPFGLYLPRPASALSPPRASKPEDEVSTPRRVTAPRHRIPPHPYVALSIPVQI